MSALSESHTNHNSGVTMRGKESLVVTDSRIVVFWDKEVKKAVRMIQKAESPTPSLSIEP